MNKKHTKIENAQLKYEREVMAAALKPLALWRKDVEHGAAISTLFRICEGLEKRIRLLEAKR